MRIAGALGCSFVNGEGARYVVFLQGCDHHCKGCQNPETWDFNGGFEVGIDALVRDIGRRPLLDGITLSGGDPFYQQEACVQLLKEIPHYLNVWIYTGFDYEEIKDTELAQMADVLVTGPYIESLKCDGKMYGSSNQEIHRKGE